MSTPLPNDAPVEPEHNQPPVPTLSPSATPPRVVVFAIQCTFAQVVLAHLQEANANMVGVLLPGPPSAKAPLQAHFPGLVPATSVPVLAIGDINSRGLLEMLAEMRPDVAVVACYPRLIPRALRAIPVHGGINIHPSLLPRWRGPDPLFWTLRQGDGVAGVTVHALTGRYDAGPIYAQRYVPYADGTTEAELDVLLARTGSELALRVISQLCQGRAQAVAQTDQDTSYAPWPEPDDFELDLQGSARSAFNFARGISQRGHPITITLNGKAHEVRNVVAWWPDDAQPPGALPPDASVVAFSTGQLAAHIVPMPATHTLRP